LAIFHFVCKVFEILAFFILGLAQIGYHAGRDLLSANRPIMIGVVENPLGLHVNRSDNQDREQHNRQFLCLLAEYERQLTGYVHTLVPSWQDAEDILQDTKLRLWEQFGSFQPGTDFAAWAFTIAGYMVRKYRKDCQRQRVCFSDDLLEKLSRHVARTAALPTRDDRVFALVECVKALNDASRKLLRLFSEGHRRIKDIASELGQTPSATYSSLFRIRRSLLDCVRTRLREKKST
jgi:RNA polymerase sigma-70 factor (ECF subfamily)